MKRNFLYNILIVTALVAGCNKVELDPQDGEPVFTAAMELDGNLHEWQAGVDDYYMFSDFEKDAADVYTFTALFAQEDSCCGESLAFYFRDLQQLPQGIPNIVEALDQDFGFVDMSGNDTIPLTIQDTIWNTAFVASTFTNQSAPIIYEWHIGNQSIVNTSEDSIMHVFQNTPIQVPVTLIAKNSDTTCSSFLTRSVSFGGNTPTCSVELKVDSINNIQLEVIANPSGIAPYSYSWSDSSTNATFVQDFNPIGTTEASVTVTDATGCTVSAGLSTTGALGTLPPFCIAVFDYSIVQDAISIDTFEVIFADSLRFSKATIVYTTENGIEYRSDRQAQPSGSSIQILDVEDYDINEKGQKTKKLTVEFTCRLWSSQGIFLDVTDGTAVIAVAYP